MANPDWCRWYPSKWATGVIGLTPEQRGVYIDIISRILDGKEVPTDWKWLGKLCNCNAQRVRRIVGELILAGKLAESSGKLRQNRAETERKLAMNFAETGRLLARKRWNNNDIDDAASECKPQPQPQKEEESLLCVPPASPSARKANGDARGTRLAEDWEPGDDGVEYARKLGLSDDAINAAYHAFMRYWLAKAGAAGRKVRWDLTWQTWMRNENDKLREKAAREEAWRERYAGPRH